jgi:hypothetical protein
MTMISEDRQHALSAASQAFQNRGIDIACPWDGDLDDLERERFDAMVAAIDAYNELTHPPSGEDGEVKVKPLQWSRWDDGGEDAIFSCWATNCDPFTYAIVQYTDDGDFSLSGIGRYASLDAAKSAAQADYETRIGSALLSTIKEPTDEVGTARSA